MITNLPNPLPECARCKAAVRRRPAMPAVVVCAGCMTGPEQLAAAEHAARLRATTTRTTRTVNDRINRLRDKRARKLADATGGTA